MAMDFSVSNTEALVPQQEIIQDTCCQCGNAFHVHWDAWSGMYSYLYEWEESSVFCSAKCLELFEQTLCYDCNHPRSLCFHALIESYDYAENTETTETTDITTTNDVWAYRELYAGH